MFGFSYPGQTYPAGYPSVLGVVILSEDGDPITGVPWAPILAGAPWGGVPGVRWAAVSDAGPAWASISGHRWPSIDGSGA